MKKRILAYMTYVDEEIEREYKEGNVDLNKMIKNHLTQIAFFAHERLIHLIVTVLFAIGTFMTVFTFVMSQSIELVPLIVLLLVLLVPYVMHYYLLENGVQRMYEQYDKLLEMKEAKEAKEAKGAKEVKEENETGNVNELSANTYRAFRVSTDK